MTDTERAAIEAIRSHDSARLITSQDGHAMTVGRLCELALEQPAEGKAVELEQRIKAYLLGGGLFNPELANHDAVRDLLIDCRNALTSLPAPSAPSPQPASESEERRLLREAYRVLKRHYHAPALRREIDALLAQHERAAVEDVTIEMERAGIAAAVAVWPWLRQLEQHGIPPEPFAAAYIAMRAAAASPTNEGERK